MCICCLELFSSYRVIISWSAVCPRLPLGFCWFSLGINRLFLSLFSHFSLISATWMKRPALLIVRTLLVSTVASSFSLFLRVLNVLMRVCMHAISTVPTVLFLKFFELWQEVVQKKKKKSKSTLPHSPPLLLTLISLLPSFPSILQSVPSWSSKCIYTHSLFTQLAFRSFCSLDAAQAFIWGPRPQIWNISRVVVQCWHCKSKVASLGNGTKLPKKTPHVATVVSLSQTYELIVQWHLLVSL